MSGAARYVARSSGLDGMMPVNEHYTGRDKQYVLASDYDALAAESERLREALSTAKYRIEQGRVWDGMGWTLTGLHPLGQQKALDAIDEALSSGKEVD